MKIYETNQKPPDDPEWYSLSVINKWDCITPCACYYNTGNGHYTIHLSVNHNTRNPGAESWKSRPIEKSELTDEMREEIKKMGYLL